MGCLFFFLIDFVDFIGVFALDAENNTLFSGGGFSWKSMNPSIASVDPDTGLVFTHSSGETTVVVQLLGSTLTDSVIVGVN